MDILKATYVPTIFLRNAELKAVRELPDASKEDLFPIFCLKPWKTAKSLDAAMLQITKAFGEREYFLDIDPFDPVKEVKRPAQSEFLELLDHSDNNQSWVDFFEKYPLAYPCLQVNHGQIDAVSNQISEFSEREKFFLVRLEYGSGVDFFGIIDQVCKTEHSNFGFVIDAGWSRDLLSRASWADALVKRIVSQRGSSVSIIISGSSFPNSFVDVEYDRHFEVFERKIFAQLQQNNNQARLVYGDWGSSRSPSEATAGGHPIPPRVDLAVGIEWISFRCREEDGGFERAAIEAANSKAFPKTLPIWATYMIEATKIGDPDGIKSLHDATAVRINMHLYRQLNFDTFDPAPDLDDDYVE